MSKELKMYALKATKKPTKSTTLLSTVQVINEAWERGYCYASFSDKLVEAVGKKLPRGISDQDPAFLSVLYLEGAWHIIAMYTSQDYATLMWKTPNKPSWLSFHKIRKPKKAQNATDLHSAEDLPPKSTARRSPTGATKA